MSALPPASPITSHSHVPAIAALLTFVRDTLKREPEDITSWDMCIIGGAQPRTANWTIRFGDDTEGFGGTSILCADGVWRVQTFRAVLTIWQ